MDDPGQYVAETEGQLVIMDGTSPVAVLDGGSVTGLDEDYCLDGCTVLESGRETYLFDGLVARGRIDSQGRVHEYSWKR